MRNKHENTFVYIWWMCKKMQKWTIQRKRVKQSTVSCSIEVFYANGTRKCSVRTVFKYTVEIHTLVLHINSLNLKQVKLYKHRTHIIVFYFFKTDPFMFPVSSNNLESLKQANWEQRAALLKLYNPWLINVRSCDAVVCSRPQRNCLWQAPQSVASSLERSSKPQRNINKTRLCFARRYTFHKRWGDFDLKYSYVNADH